MCVEGGVTLDCNIHGLGMPVGIFFIFLELEMGLLWNKWCVSVCGLTESAFSSLVGGAAQPLAAEVPRSAHSRRDGRHRG